MTTPVETIADALISFIMSLLHDPAAVEEFDRDPDAALAASGIRGACAADVRAVAPVVIDHPSVTPMTPVTVGTSPTKPLTHVADPPNEVAREISRIINQFTTIDNRATIIDQSTNQNIWTNGGDVTQIFDQDAVVASGDDAMAAGHDLSVDESDTQVTTGDISIGNTTGSHNVDVDVDDTAAVSDAVEDASTADGDDASVPDATTDPALAGSIVDAATVGVDAAVGVDATETTGPETTSAPAADEAADSVAPLMVDPTSDGYDSSEPLVTPEPEPYLEDVVDDQ